MRTEEEMRQVIREMSNDYKLFFNTDAYMIILTLAWVLGDRGTLPLVRRREKDNV